MKKQHDNTLRQRERTDAQTHSVTESVRRVVDGVPHSTIIVRPPF